MHLDNPRRSHMEYEQVLTERSLIKKYAYWKQILQQFRKTTDKKLSRGWISKWMSVWEHYGREEAA